ncbi:MAG TPA: hypothetical protein P5513_06740 [Candidatus Diapherotrites archaeon]|nr:hypothetical protein [Candidatus Diapherotrites archaeon]
MAETLMCPFQSEAEIVCLAEACKLYKATDVEGEFDCVFNIILTKLVEANTKLTDNNTKLDISIEKLTNIETTNSEISIVEQHKHFQHDHQKLHNSDSLELEPGANTFSKNLTTTANQLLAEHLGNEDLDGNDKIYGVDFYIDPTDPNLSDFLKNYQAGITITSSMEKLMIDEI